MDQNPKQKKNRSPVPKKDGEHPPAQPKIAKGRKESNPKPKRKDENPQPQQLVPVQPVLNPPQQPQKRLWMKGSIQWISRDFEASDSTVKAFNDFFRYIGPEPPKIKYPTNAHPHPFLAFFRKHFESLIESVFVKGDGEKDLAQWLDIAGGLCRHASFKRTSLHSFNPIFGPCDEVRDAKVRALRDQGVVIPPTCHCFATVSGQMGDIVGNFFKPCQHVEKLHTKVCLTSIDSAYYFGVIESLCQAVNRGDSVAFCRHIFPASAGVYDLPTRYDGIPEGRVSITLKTYLYPSTVIGQQLLRDGLTVDAYLQVRQTCQDLDQHLLLKHGYWVDMRVNGNDTPYEHHIGY